MNTLFVLNDAPYGSERCYNALRLGLAILKKEPQTKIAIFLMADAVTAAKQAQETPDGYYNIGRMFRRLLASGVGVLLCGTCMAARGVKDEELLEGARRSNMDELAELALSSDRVMVW